MAVAAAVVGNRSRVSDQSRRDVQPFRLTLAGRPVHRPFRIAGQPSGLPVARPPIPAETSEAFEF